MAAFQRRIAAFGQILCGDPRKDEPLSAFNGLLLVVLLPTLYFVIVFWPAIGRHLTYGNFVNQRQLAVDLNRYGSEPSSAQLSARQPELLHPDYHLLYEPAAEAIQRAYRSWRIPLYNDRRMFGTQIWGSPVADPANPLTLLLIFLSTDTVHLVKIYVYTLVAFWGVFACCTRIVKAGLIAALVAASMYVLNPFEYYFYHWSSIYGVTAILPAILLAMHLYLLRPSFPRFASLEILTGWVLVINQLQVVLYFVIFLSLWLLVALILDVYPRANFAKRLCFVLLAPIGGLFLSLGQTWYVIANSSALTRQAHTYAQFRAAGPELFSVRPLIALWLNVFPLDRLHYDARLFFVPLLAIGVVILYVFNQWRSFDPSIRLVACMATLLSVHFFITPLHYPLYAVHLPLYTLNPEHWRAIIFYI